MVSDADTIANFTNHAYFNLAGHDAGSVLTQKVWIDADTYTIPDAESIPTTEFWEPVMELHGFTELKTIGDEIDADYEPLKNAGGYDHNWVLETALPGELALSARAVDEASGRTMDVYTDLPGVQFYTANGLKGQVKGGVLYDPRYGYCETQYFLDAVNNPRFASPHCKAGEEYKPLPFIILMQNNPCLNDSL